MAGKQVFSGCRVSHSTSENVLNTTDTWLAYDTERFDTENYHSPTVNNSRLTIPQTGYYLVGAHIAWDTNNAGTRQMFLQVNRNNSIAYVRQGPPASDGLALSLMALWRFSAGDYVEVLVNQNSAGTRTIGAPDGTQGYVNEFWITRMGF